MTDKDKEREAFEAHWIKEGNPRNSLAKWNYVDNVPAPSRGAYVMACTRDAWGAFQAGRASLAASAGSEPVAGTNEYGVRGYLAATLKCWHRLTGDEAAELVAMTQRLAGLYPHPSPPEGMVGGWKLGLPITEEMHVAAVKVLHRAAGLDGLPQRMLDAMIAAAPPIAAGGGKEA